MKQTIDPREKEASKCRSYWCGDCLNLHKDTYHCVILFGKSCPDFSNFTPKTGKK